MSGPERDNVTSVWDRPEPTTRPAPAPLSRERIVAAGIALADADGLDSVSVRKVAAALAAGPMRLYGYFSTKNELFDLMADAVYGEILAPGPPAGGGRAALRELSHRVRDAVGRHPWFADLLAERPRLGPHAFAFLEARSAAAASLPGVGEDIDAVLRAAGVVQAYVVGALRQEATERAAERESGLDEPAWQAASGPAVARLLDTGRYPTVARIVADACHPDPRDAFDAGLTLVLDGVAGSADPEPFLRAATGGAESTDPDR